MYTWIRLIPKLIGVTNRQNVRRAGIRTWNKSWNKNFSRDARASEKIEFRNLSSTRVCRVYRENF